MKFTPGVEFVWFLTRLVFPGCLQIDNDTKFLAEMGCMDYSMLVGVHKRSQLSVARNPTAGSIESPWARQDAPASLGTRGHSPSRSSPHGVVALMRRRDLLKTGSLVTVSRCVPQPHVNAASYGLVSISHKANQHMRGIEVFCTTAGKRATLQCFRSTMAGGAPVRRITGGRL